MNNLNRAIKAGEEVVVIPEAMQTETNDLKSRVFICERGFGMNPCTSSAKIFGTWKTDGSTGTIRGDLIDEKATIQHQAKTRLGAGKQAARQEGAHVS